jgi:hypothetical protein
MIVATADECGCGWHGSCGCRCGVGRTNDGRVSKDELAVGCGVRTAESIVPITRIAPVVVNGGTGSGRFSINTRLAPSSSALLSSIAALAGIGFSSRRFTAADRDAVVVPDVIADFVAAIADRYAKAVFPAVAAADADGSANTDIAGEAIDRCRRKSSISF